MMRINKKICPKGLKNNPNKFMTKIENITIHTTGNRAATANALMHANYQYNGSGGREASWHYTVDKDEIWQSFEDYQMCWHAGATLGNSNSIGIEICVNDSSGFKKACENAAELTAGLMKKYNLTIDKVVEHHHWSGKNCPAELRSGEWGITWSNFKLMVKSVLQAEPEKRTADLSPWAVEAWNWAIKNKITDGSFPLHNASREQVIQMIYNYEQYRMRNQ